MEEMTVEMCETTEVHEELLKTVRETMPEETELYDLAELFKVFGDSTRIRILFVLFEAEVCVCDLAQALGMTQSAISHQLRIHQQLCQTAGRGGGGRRHPGGGGRTDGRESRFSIPLRMSMSGQSSRWDGSISRRNRKYLRKSSKRG